MPIPKKYFHDHLVLLLLSINAFVAVAGSIFMLVRLSSSHGTSFIVQYRPILGADTYKTGSGLDLVSFIAFALLIFATNTVLSVRAYNVHRQLTIAILSMGILLLVLAVVISNALLMLR